MEDLEFYQKALICLSWITNRSSEIPAYHWDGNFCKDEITRSFKKFSTEDITKEVFKLENITKERAKFLQFKNWDEDMPDLYLFPLWYAKYVLQYGTKCLDIFGKECIYTDKTDMDIRMGCVSFGIELK